MVENLIDDLLNVNTFSREVDMMDDFFKNQFIESIRNQISTKKNLEVSDFNVIETLERRYAYLETVFMDDNNILDKIRKNRSDVYNIILKEISQQFAFTYELTYAQQVTEELYRILDSVFFFFVENYATNVQDLMMQYILKNKKELSKKYDASLKNRDIEIAMFKKAINDPDLKRIAIVIVTNIEDVVNDTISELKENPIEIIRTLHEFDIDEVSMSIVGDLFLEKEDSDLLPAMMVDDGFASTFLSVFDNPKFRKHFIDNLRLSLTDVFLSNSGAV